MVEMVYIKNIVSKSVSMILGIHHHHRDIATSRYSSASDNYSLLKRGYIESYRSPIK